MVGSNPDPDRTVVCLGKTPEPAVGWLKFKVLIIICFVTDEDGTERVCDTLLMCIITVLNQGLRNGGGVGDILRRPSKEVNTHTSTCTTFTLYSLNLWRFFLNKLPT